MSSRTTSATLLLTLLAGAAGALLRAPGQHTVTTRSEPASAKGGGSGRSASREGGTQEVREFPSAPYLLDRFASAGIAPRRGGGLVPAGVLIATVPDPTDSHMDWAFDAYLESIRRAYETAGFVLDRFWLPWSETNDTMMAAPDSGRVQRRVREEYPGVLVFRKAFALPPAHWQDALPKTVFSAKTLEKGPPPDTATRASLTLASLRRAAEGIKPENREVQIVYLVGEVPTAGIHKGALYRALIQRDSLPVAASDPVRIVGPSFSGSTASLAWALREWSDGTGRSRARADSLAPVKIISGTATVPANREALTGGAAGPSVEFSATVNSDAMLERVLIESVLCPLRIAPEHVLMLRESGTAYGSADDGIRARCRGEEWNTANFLSIPFPMNVSSLRGELDAHPAEGDGEGGAGARRSSRTHLSLTDPERPMEHLPATSGLTAPTLEVLMDQIEAVVARNQVRAVGILASDVRDKLFLAEEMRRRVQDAQLFTFEGNALFLVPEKNPALRGMLVLSTYPLNLRNQWWSPGGAGAQRIPFSSEGAEGVYNAVLFQLNATGRLAEYEAPFGLWGRRTPPVWVTAVGSRSMVPVLVRPANDPGYVAVGGAAQAPAGKPLGVAFFTALAVLGLAAAILYCAANAVRAEPVKLIPFKRETDGTPVRGGGGSRARLEELVRSGSQLVHRHLYSLLRLLALLSVFVPVTVLVCSAVAKERDVFRSLLSATLAVGAAIGLVAAGVSGTRVLLARRPGKAPDTGPSPGVPQANAGRAVPLAVVGSGAVAVAVVLLEGLIAWMALTVLSTVARAIPGAWDRVMVYVLFLAAVAGAAAAVWHLWLALSGLGRLSRDGVDYLVWGWGGQWRRQLAWFGENVGRALVVVGGAVFFVAAMAFALAITERFAGNPSYPLFLERASRLDSGVSPVLPLALAGAGFAMWCTWHLARITLLEYSTPFEKACWAAANPAAADPPTHEATIHEFGLRSTAAAEDAARRGEQEEPGLGERVAEVRRRLFQVIPNQGGVLALALLLGLGVLLAWQFKPTLESVLALDGFELLLQLSMVGSLVATTWAVYRLVVIWRALHRVLAAVGETPLLPAFRRLPHSAAQLTRLTLWAGSRCDLVKNLAATQWRQLKTIHSTAAKDSIPTELRVEVGKLMDSASEPGHRVRGPLCDKRDDLFLRVTGVLEKLWEKEPDSIEADKVHEILKDQEKTDTGSVFRQRITSPARLWMRAAEEFAAVQVVGYLEWVLQQMRTLALFLFVTLLLTTALVSSYPFQPQSLVKLVFLFVLIGTVAALLYVMVAMNRDEVLSYIADTDPGRVTWDWSFALNVGLVALVPLLTLISSEVPGLHTALFSWIQPILKALTHGG